MAHKILKKDKLDGWIRDLSRERDVFAPARENGKTVWAPVTEAASVDWTVGNTDMSPKEFFFPQTECLLRFKNTTGEDGMILTEVEPMARERVLLNVRPCDAKAFKLLDRIFVQDEQTNDPYWREKREKTIMIGLGCANPAAECFCTSTGCGPFHEEGLDVLLTDLGDRLLVTTLTDKGEALMGKLPKAAAKDTDEAARIKGEAEAAMPLLPGFEAEGAIADKSVLEIYGLPMWDRVCEPCLNCGACTFVCPTCHCFDIQDEVKGENGRRVRNWDTCMQWLFTQHASGHNPRGKKVDRVRQRFMHKFKYIPMKRDGVLGCVGCGRCVRLCPTNIDVRQVVRLMDEEAKAVTK